MLASSNALTTVLILLFTFYIYNKIQYYRLRRINGCRPAKKYRHKDPILGLDLFFKTKKSMSEDQSLPEQFQRYMDLGMTFESLHMGNLTVNTIDPENLKAIYANSNSEWGVQPARLRAMEPFCGRGLITVDGPGWARSRRLFQSSFEKGVISDFSGLEELLQKLFQQVPRDGTTVDLAPPLTALFVDSTTQFLFGDALGMMADAESSNAQLDANDVAKSFTDAMFGSAIRIALGPFQFLGNTKAWQQACKRTHSFAQKYVEKALSHRKDFVSKGKTQSQQDSRQHKIFIYNLVEQTTDAEQIRNEVLQAFFTSLGTTAYLVANVIFILSRHPDILSKLRTEVSELPDGPPTYEQLAKMSYLKLVMNEVLRLYPILPTNARTALKNATLPTGGGPSGKSPISIPKGSRVTWSYYVLHRHPTLWGPDADIFSPKRWEQHKPKPFEYIPFGAGQRVCVGQQKGLMDASYVVVRILQEFSRIESRDERVWKGHVDLSTQNANGCFVGLFGG